MRTLYSCQRIKITHSQQLFLTKSHPEFVLGFREKWNGNGEKNY